MKTVFFDVDTQLDFMYPAGALYVPGAEKIVEQIAALNRFAGAQGIPLVSTMDAHTENDPEFQAWPPHCVAGCIGQHKPEATLLSRRLVVPNTPVEVAIDGAQQILLEKQTFDCFTNVNLARLLERLGAERYVVYGVVTEICVKLAAWGPAQNRQARGTGHGRSAQPERCRRGRNDGCVSGGGRCPDNGQRGDTQALRLKRHAIRAQHAPPPAIFHEIFPRALALINQHVLLRSVPWAFLPWAA